jgi:hypothetical protein
MNELFRTSSRPQGNDTSHKLKEMWSVGSMVKRVRMWKDQVVTTSPVEAKNNSKFSRVSR